MGDLHDERCHPNYGGCDGFLEGDCMICAEVHWPNLYEKTRQDQDEFNRQQEQAKRIYVQKRWTELRDAIRAKEREVMNA